jgi:hypothetical protein
MGRDRIPAIGVLRRKDLKQWLAGKLNPTTPLIPKCTTYAGTARLGTTSNQTNADQAIRASGGSASGAKTLSLVELSGKDHNGARNNAVIQAVQRLGGTDRKECWQ